MALMLPPWLGEALNYLGFSWPISNEDVLGAWAEDFRPLQLDGSKRARHNPRTPDKQPGDHAGHIFGNLFGGSPQLDNLISQSSDINKSQYRKLEIEWAERIRNGEKIDVDVRIVYGDSGRPTKFIFKETTPDGNPRTHIFRQ